MMTIALFISCSRNTNKLSVARVREDMAEDKFTQVMMANKIIMTL